jgi:hypothetical protein
MDVGRHATVLQCSSLLFSVFKVGEGEWKTRICWIDRYETYTDSQLCLLYAFAMSPRNKKGLVQSAAPVYISPVSFKHVEWSVSI